MTGRSSGDRRWRPFLPLLLAALLAGETPAQDAPDRLAPAEVAGAKHVDAALQRRIDDSIEGATRWLLRSVRDDGSLPPSALTRAGTYRVGLAALAGYALRHGGVERADPRMARLRDFVHRGVTTHVPDGKDARPDLDVYSAGLAIAFLLEAGVARDDPALVRTVRWLEDSWTEAGWWHYALVRPVRSEPGRPGGAAPPPQRGTFGNASTTLYAVLGLHAATRHGVAVDTSGLRRLMGCLASRQTRDGGFLYMDTLPTETPNARPYFGATSNAVAAYLLAGEATGTFRTPADAAKDRIVEDALPFLEARFGRGHWGNRVASVRGNQPGARVVGSAGDGLTTEDTYNLYATERIGMLLATDAIGKLRWYERGAQRLVDAQAPDGRWAARDVAEYPDAATTAFGLLFLARSVRPIGRATTPRDEVAVTGAAPEAFSFDGAPGMDRLEWHDLFHRALERLEALGGDARARFAPRFANLGPRVVRALVFELESERRERRRAAADVLVAVTRDDVGFAADGSPEERARGISAWRTWLAAWEPHLVLVDGSIVVRTVPEPPRPK